jgi:hypothetical protein
LTGDRSNAKLDPLLKTIEAWEIADEFAPPVRVVDHDRLARRSERDGMLEEDTAAAAPTSVATGRTTTAAATAAAAAAAGTSACSAASADRGGSVREEDAGSAEC